MNVKMTRNSLWFLLVCLGLGILAELSFFHGKIGISYLVFITGFYAVVFGRYRLAFNNRRIGLLLMIVIWMLASSFAFYDNILFRHFNILLIPAFMFFHIVLITSPNNTKWSKPAFIVLLATKLQEGIHYAARFCKLSFMRLFKNMKEETAQIIKRIIIGLAIGLPILFVVTSLLMSADTVFQDMVLKIPNFIVELDFLESTFRSILAIILSLLFFGIFQVLSTRIKPKEYGKLPEAKSLQWDGITALTIVILLNVVYVLFTAIQFKYFFSDGLLSDYTYSEYARRGFFELIFVTLINGSLLVSFLKLVKEDRKPLKLLLKLMYSLLIAASGVMLTSAYQRLSMYEDAYGFTLDRVLAHGFMIFLMVIFAYTFIRVWLEQLSILHFYMIVGLIFYAGMNVVGLERIVVANNIERYEETGKIDIHYLSNLSYTGINGLLDLYEEDPDIPELEKVLKGKKERLNNVSGESWQSFNFMKQKVKDRLEELNL